MEPIDNLIGIVNEVGEKHGKEKMKECKEVVSTGIKVSLDSFETNYMQGKSYSRFKVPFAIEIAQNFSRELNLKPTE